MKTTDAKATAVVKSRAKQLHSWVDEAVESRAAKTVVALNIQKVRVHYIIVPLYRHRY